MNSEERNALVREMVEEGILFLEHDHYAFSNERALVEFFEQRLLSERETTVPDAERAERVARAIKESWASIESEWKRLRGHEPLWNEMDDIDARDMARAALAAAGPEIASFPSPDFEWDAESIIEAREDAGEPPDPDTAQRTAEIAHDVLTTFQITLSTYPFSNLNTVVWLVSEMVRITEERAAAGLEEDWLDAALDSVHPLARVDVVARYVDDSCPNDEIEIGGWRAYVSYPEKGKRTMGFETVYAEGPTRTAAIATALAAKQEGGER